MYCKLPEEEGLDTVSLAKTFTVLNRSYKLFWFRGVLAGAEKGKSIQTFGEIVDRMAEDAWKIVLQLHLSLGFADTLEKLIHTVNERAKISGYADRKNIEKALKKYEDQEITEMKLRLLQQTPYQFLSQFMGGELWTAWEDQEATLKRINKDEKMIYTIGPEEGLGRIVQIRPEWMTYFKHYSRELSDVTKELLIHFLEQRNPKEKNIREKLVRQVWIQETAVAKSKAANKAAAEGAKNNKKKGLTPSQKLWRRIRKEFPKKKFIGDIQISDEEFALLVKYLREQDQKLAIQPALFRADEVFCVTLVQFGIRFYETGSYWPNVEKMIRSRYYKSGHCNTFGTEFLRFMGEKGKLLSADKKAMSNILLHGFVSDKKSHDLFNFLYSYYCIDLSRDIDRLDRQAMNDLVRAIQTNDGRKRTYNLVEHTADAVRLNEIGGKIRLRRYLKLIDRAFMEPEDFTTRSSNRLMRRFAEWCNTDTEKIYKERNSAQGYSFRHRTGWKPYLRYDDREDVFCLVLPSRLVCRDDEQETHWVIVVHEEEITLDAQLEPAVTGFVTKEILYELKPEEIFGSIETILFSNGARISRSTIQKDSIRFFETNGDHIETKVLRPGDAVSFSLVVDVPNTDALYHMEPWGNLVRCSYQFEDGDLLIFPDHRVLSIGKKPSEGLLKRGQVRNVFGQREETSAPVYAVAPSVFARILPKSMNGTQLRINGQHARIFEKNEPLPGVYTFDLQEGVPEQGVHISLNQYGVKENGLYHVELDIPNDRAGRSWDFLLINGLEYSFDGAPYIFADNGTLCVPEQTGLETRDSSVRPETAEGQRRFAFAIPENEDSFPLYLGDIRVCFEIPKLSYRYPDEEVWRTKRELSIWHEDLPNTMEVRFPADSMMLLLDEEGNESEDEEQHFQAYTRSVETDSFQCNLHPFRSWLGKRVANRRLYIQFPEMKKPERFLNINTKNVLLSAVLTADLEEDILQGEFDIVGKAPSCADVYRDDTLLVGKEPIVNGKLSFHTDIQSGFYRVDVFESGNDGDGFDEMEYELLGTRKMELVNPYNLTGQHIQVTHLMRKNSENYLRLKRTFTLYDLQPMPDWPKGYYSGHMVVREKEYGKYRNDFPACVHIPDPSELARCHIFRLDEYGDEYCIIYDNDRCYMRAEEDKTVTGVTRYRRFSYLMEDEYTFRIDFVEKPADMENRLQQEKLDRQLALEGREQDEDRRAYQRKLDPLCQPIRDIGLSMTICNVLKEAGILYTTDLKNMTVREISRIKGLNRTDVEQCIVHLRQAGYRISMF